MSDVFVGYDRQKKSTPFNLVRGSSRLIRRVCYTYDPDQGTESILDISGATEITWHLLLETKKGTASKIAKTKSASQIAFTNTGTDGKYDFTVAESDTVSLDLGFYKAEMAVVIGGKRYKFTPYVVQVMAAANLGE